MKKLEQEAIKILNSAIAKWTPEFNIYSLRFGTIELNNKGDENDYFSEIESFIWQENNVFDVVNIILFLNGKQLITLDEIPMLVNNTIESIIKKFQGNAAKNNATNVF